MIPSRRLLTQFLITSLLGFCLISWTEEKPETSKSSAIGLSEKPIALPGSEIGDLLRKWYSQGTAAGNLGDYYDNRDGGHSQLDLAPYPQLQKHIYTEAQIKARQNWGLQRQILPYVVFGNSSTSAPPTQGGSNPRNYYVQTSGLNFLFAQYSRNNLYIYPEHQDHDPGHNGIGGYGDLFPTNTPYLFISQGSSGSDKPFMQVLPYILAAFRPEVKNKLVQYGLLMPTVQMVLRSTNKRVGHPDDYLTGKAHPTVFEGNAIDALKAVSLAHAITLSNLPPIALVKAIREDASAVGTDYFEPELTEKLADTPAVIARVFRGSNHLRKIMISAESSKDINNRPLKFFWKVLRGDSSRINIAYRNPSHSVAEIIVPYHDRFPIPENPEIESNRVDIGVFVHNGVYFSPPAFVTFFMIDNEARTYDADGRLADIGYDAGTAHVSIADWSAFFNTLTSDINSWTANCLRKRFSPTEIAVLTNLAADYQKSHALVLAAEKKNAETIAAQKQKDKTSDAVLRSARKVLEDAKESENQVLEKKIPELKQSASALVEKVLHSLLQDTNLWTVNADALTSLYKSAPQESQAAFDKVGQLLISFGVAEKSKDKVFLLKSQRSGEAPLQQRLTRYEIGMIERLNAVILSRILYPGFINAEWRVNYVDPRIVSEKKWRDVYQYAPDGTSLGWRRFQSDGIQEFNADGFLILDKDAQGRYLRAQKVKYEIVRPPPESRNNPQRIVRMIPINEFREYQIK